MSGCSEYNALTRREVLGRGVALGAASLLPAWMPRLAFGQAGTNRDTLIRLYLGGGIDGLTICVPHAESAYYDHRPNIAVPDPSSSSSLRATDLDGFFGLPPSLAPLKETYDDGNLLFVHATGADKTHWTRSHFNAGMWMETGKTNDPSMGSGWIGRHLATTTAVPNSSIRAIGSTRGTIQALRGGPKSIPLPRPDKHRFLGQYPHKQEMVEWLANAYRDSQDPFREIALDAIDSVSLLNSIVFEPYLPSGGAVYPQNSEIGYALRTTAAMLKAGVPLEAVAIHFDGWDTHDRQGSTDGYMHRRLTEVGQALLAFYQDMMSSNCTSWTLVGMSEFGRNVKENGSDGCDHGTGNAMFLMGGKVNGGQVIRDWPGLRSDQLYEGHDLRVTIDYRDILAEVVSKRLKNQNLGAVFPGYTPTFRNALAA